MNHPGKRLLVLIPALNEEATIATVVSGIPRQIDGIAAVDVLVVDDGSSDETASRARTAGATVISHKSNLGLGTALQTGIGVALDKRYDVVVNIDGDGQFSAGDIPRLVEPVRDGRADMTTASRFKDKELIPEMPFAKRWGNWAMSLLISSISGTRLHDVSCGFRCYSREALLRLVLTGKFTYTQESILVLLLRQMRIDEIPTVVRGVREHGKSRVASNLFRYGMRTSSIIFGFIRDYRPGPIFVGASLLLMLVALLFGSFFLWHRITAGQFTPHLWAGFTAGFLAGAAMLLFFMGQVAISVARLRRMQEEVLYFVRRDLVGRDKDAS